MNKTCKFYNLITITAVVIVVRDVSTNSPIPNVTVTVIVDGETLELTTDSNGRINLGQQPVGSSLTVSANLDGYVSFSRDFTVVSGQTVFVDISPEIQVRLLI